ncbi:MAG: primosomal protein N', partial [Pseudomonadota bacterium]
MNKTTHNKVAILLPLIFRKPFDYKIPEGINVNKGDYVKVPFGGKSLWGVAWSEAEGEVEEAKIKEIFAVAEDIPAMKNSMMKLIDWVSWYTLSPLGMVLKMAMPIS